MHYDCHLFHRVARYEVLLNCSIPVYVKISSNKTLKQEEKQHVPLFSS